VLNIGSTTPDAFDDVEISVAHILGSTAASALERADREETLREQQEALEQHNERLEQFASVLSHDLRNPLAVAQGRLELLQEECDSEHIQPVVDAHDRIDQMIEDLLLLAREGRSITETEPVEVAAVARDAWRVVDGDASLEIDCEDDQITADRARLRQLFENLFRNAIEHAGPEPTIRVGCSADGFFVADDGPGIPTDQREQVFEFGYTGSGGGTGLGLAIVHEIVEGHGWSIDISESEAGGARFDVRVDPD
jgi:signal transduction histidine kinase